MGGTPVPQRPALATCLRQCFGGQAGQVGGSILDVFMLPKHIYMVGIGGIGMSALAQLFAHQGKIVSGSDREASKVTQMLEEKGIRVHIGHDEKNLPEDAELVIFSDAVWDDNLERREAARRGLPQVSYFEALGEVSRNARTIAIAGTHGKTTTAGMLAKILHDAGKEPTAIIGSIVKDFNSNFLAGTDDLFNKRFRNIRVGRHKKSSPEHSPDKPLPQQVLFLIINDISRLLIKRRHLRGDLVHMYLRPVTGSFLLKKIPIFAE